MTISHEQRTEDLLEISSHTYRALEAVVNGQVTSRVILRQGMQALAHGLERNSGDSHIAGHLYRQVLNDQLRAGGLDENTFCNFPEYAASLSHLSVQPAAWKIDDELDEFCCQYADVERRAPTTSGSFETNATHVSHLTVVGLAYATKYYPNLDQSLLAGYSLLHDAVEAYAGDTPTLDVTAEALAEKQVREQAAMIKIEQQFTKRHPKMISMLHDYENLVDAEARFVKTFDKLDPRLAVLHTKSNQLADYFGLTEKRYRQVALSQTIKMAASYGKDFPDVLNIREILTEKIIDQTNW